MNSREFWFAVGDICKEGFELLIYLGNGINWIFIIIIIIALTTWLFMQGRYNAQEIREQGSIK